MFNFFFQVKHIEKGINPPSLDEIFFHGDNLTKGFKIGVVAGLIGLTVYSLIEVDIELHSSLSSISFHRINKIKNLRL